MHGRRTIPRELHWVHLVGVEHRWARRPAPAARETPLRGLRWGGRLAGDREGGQFGGNYGQRAIPAERTAATIWGAASKVAAVGEEPL